MGGGGGEIEKYPKGKFFFFQDNRRGSSLDLFIRSKKKKHPTFIRLDLSLNYIARFLLWDYEDRIILKVVGEGWIYNDILQ